MTDQRETQDGAGLAAALALLMQWGRLTESKPMPQASVTDLEPSANLPKVAQHAAQANEARAAT